jgi:ribosome-interacting GTPase 1
MEKLLIKVPVSLGELVDKITILRIKKTCMSDAEKIDNVSKEYNMLVAIPEYLAVKDVIADKEHALLKVNQRLWWYEEDIRAFDRTQWSNTIAYMQVAKGIHITNDERSRIKKEINIMCNSELVEEKSYE